MRLKKTEIRRRVNGNLTLRFEQKGLTSFAGIELLRQFFSQIGLRSMVRRYLGRHLPQSDYGASSMLLLLVIMIIAGGKRVRHVLHLAGDPVISRTCGMRRLPSPRSIGRWLSGTNEGSVAGGTELNEALVADGIHATGQRRLTVDVDGSVISTGLTVEGAERGFNPHQRKKPSYYPISAYEAQSGLILRVANRRGNIHDGKESIGFLNALFDQIDRTLGTSMTEEYRMDGAFFREDVISLLERRRAEYAIKVPFFTWIGLKALIAENRNWTRVDGTVSCFERQVEMKPWRKTLRVVIYRKKVAHETRKNFQLDLFDPSNGHYEYSAVVTNKTISGTNLWAFINGRGTHEKVYGELKSGYAFDSIPTHRYHANSLWQILNIVAFNLVRRFQAETIAPERSSNMRRSCLYVFESIATLRFTLFSRAGIIKRPNGTSVLDLGPNPEVKMKAEEVLGMLRAA